MLIAQSGTSVMLPRWRLAIDVIHYRCEGLAMKAKLLGSLVALAVLGPVHAQRADPYAEGARQLQVDHWWQSYNAYKNRISYLMFAFGCRVLTHEVQISLMMNGQWQAVVDEAARVLRFLPFRDFNEMRKDVEAAERNGFNHSLEPGACDDYWSKHKEEAYSLRTTANSLYPFSGPARPMPSVPPL